MAQVAVVDYGLNNLDSVLRAIRHVGGEPYLVADAAGISTAERLVLPGVGAFGAGMYALSKLGIVDALEAFAHSGKQLLGLCLGMQLFMERSEEMGNHTGLGLVKGVVTKLPVKVAGNAKFKVPHVGWAPLLPGTQAWEGSVLHGLSAGETVYFVHSYVVALADGADVLAATHYGPSEFCSVLRRGNITGCQFHPEKSGPVGLRILRNFVS